MLNGPITQNSGLRTRDSILSTSHPKLWRFSPNVLIIGADRSKGFFAGYSRPKRIAVYEIACPECSAPMEVAEAFLGQEIRCGECKQMVRIPSTPPDGAGEDIQVGSAEARNPDTPHSW